MTIRFGILGSAAIARSAMIPAIRAATGAEVDAVASRSLDKAKAFAKECGLSAAYGSYEELLAAPNIDAIYIALPIHLHKEWTIKALRAGKAVLCEKSLCLSSEDAVEMYRVAQETGHILQEVMAYRHHPMTQKVVQLIAAGAIGEVRMVHADFHSTCADLNNIRLKKECGGGALRDLGVYCIDVLRLIYNADPIQIRAQQIYGPTEVDIQSSGILKFKNGIGYFGCSLGNQYECHYEIVGSAGRLRCARGAMVAWGGENFKLDLWSSDSYEELQIPQANPYQLMIEAFVAQYQAGALLDPQNNNSLSNMRVIEAVISQATC